MIAMNALDVCIYGYQAFILTKFFTTIILSIIIFVWSIILLKYDHMYDHILIGMLISSILSITFAIKTALHGVHHVSIELFRCFILIWAIYSTVVLATTVFTSTPIIILVIMLYIVGFNNVFVMRFPYGEDGEIRV